MTVLILSVTPDRVVMSQDSFMYLLGPRAIAALGEMPGADSPSPTEAGPIPKKQPGFQVEKIARHTTRNMVVGGAGSWKMLTAWQEQLESLWPGEDISEIADKVPAQLRQIMAGTNDPVRELIVVHAGWSKGENRAIGYAYDFRADFEPIRIDSNFMTPSYFPNAPGLPELSRLSHAAHQGLEIEAFHHALYDNMLWGYEHGFVRKGGHIGGDLQMVEVSRHGINVLEAASKTGGSPPFGWPIEGASGMNAVRWGNPTCWCDEQCSEHPASIAHD